MADIKAAQERVLSRRAVREAAHAQQTAQITQARAERFASLPPALRVAVQTTLQGYDSLRSPYGNSPAFRVGQVDAELLDEELLTLLKNQAGDGLKLFGAHLKDEYDAEVKLALRAILWKLSIWDHAASYGASLQGLKYVDARNKDTAARVEATGWQRAAYGLLTVGGRYVWKRWEDRLSDLENGYDEPSPLTRRLSRLTTFLGTGHNIAAFVSFLAFLYNGRYRTLTDRLLRLRLVPSSNQTNREVSFEFLNRQLVWHAFTEFLLFLLPLVGISRWKRWLARAWRKVKTTASNIRHGKAFTEADEDDARPKGELYFLPERTCAICYADQNPAGGQSEHDIISAAAGVNTGIIGNASTDITNPYETAECGCIYCFVCLASRIEGEDGEGWACLRCGEVVRSCKPWNGDVIVPVAENVADSATEYDEKPGKGKGISWAEDVVSKDVDGFDDMTNMEPRPVEDVDEGYWDNEER